MRGISHSMLERKRWIAVLGSPSRPDGGASDIQLRRCATALKEWRKDRDSILILMGGAVRNDVVESATMRDWLLSKDVTADRLWTENRTASTRDQVKLLHEMATRFQPALITVVSDISHLPRIGMLVRHAGLDSREVRLVGSKNQEGPASFIGILAHEIANYAKDWARTLVGKW